MVLIPVLAAAYPATVRLAGLPHDLSAYPEEGGEEDGQVLDEGLLLIAAILVGCRDGGGGGQHRRQLAHEDAEQLLEVVVKLRLHTQASHLRRHGASGLGPLHVLKYTMPPQR